MNVFVLSTGRCGSMTISRAFSHATNFTSGHETEANSFYPFDYPDQHIESDNRLSWMLGGLAEKFPDARYIHLIRHRDEVAHSFGVRRDYPGASIRGFGAGILGRGDQFPEERHESAARMWDAVNANIRVFLAGRPEQTFPGGPIWLHELEGRFLMAWRWLGCEGDLDAALAETRIRHNANV